MKPLENRRKIKNSDRDLGNWTWTTKPNEYNKRLQLILRWRNDEDFCYIEILTKYHGSVKYIHYYFNSEYSKSNLRVAKEFFDLLLRSYRYDLSVL